MCGRTSFFAHGCQADGIRTSSERWPQAPSWTCTGDARRCCGRLNRIPASLKPATGFAAMGVRQEQVTLGFPSKRGRDELIAKRLGIVPSRRHLANGAPLRGALPMTGLRVMPALGCENDAGGRFTDDPGRDSQRHGSRFLCGCCGYAWFCPVGRDAPDAPTGTGATPPADALVMAWGGAGFHKPRTAPGGVAPVPMIPGGEGCPADGETRAASYRRTRASHFLYVSP